ncbi:MAG: PilZ domain-containing protein [Polyangia bacterium]
MVEKRNARRFRRDMPVSKLIGASETACWVDDLSPTGVRLRRFDEPLLGNELCRMELHLVPGSISTVVTARRVWSDRESEAWEFVSPSFAQQAMLERIAGNY